MLQQAIDEENWRCKVKAIVVIAATLAIDLKQSRKFTCNLGYFIFCKRHFDFHEFYYYLCTESSNLKISQAIKQLQKL